MSDHGSRETIVSKTVLTCEDNIWIDVYGNSRIFFTYTFTISLCFPNRSFRIDTALLYPSTEWDKASTVFRTLASSNSLRYVNLVTGGTLVLSIVSEYWPQNLGQSAYVPLNLVITSFGSFASPTEVSTGDFWLPALIWKSSCNFSFVSWSLISWFRTAFFLLVLVSLLPFPCFPTIFQDFRCDCPLLQFLRLSHRSTR